jgi:ATP/maltotriose-dependent transcriptional regulator MalT/DNA-binding SARP family transcriptional activator
MSLTSSAPLIQRKITPPPLPVAAVPRPRIESLLARLVQQHQIVCVYASPGAGKTTAIRQAAQRFGRPLAWLSVDVTDVATGRLLTYLEAALAPVVPAAGAVATAALAAHLPHVEIAGLLADTLGDSATLVVLDDVERIADEPAALAVIAAFARYLPASARLILASRSEVPFDTVGAASFHRGLAAVNEEDLAFTVQEAADALALAGQPEIDPAEAIAATGGWVTGVLFEAWRSADHVIGVGGEADPLHGYLATQILGQMEPPDREFLVSTAVLQEVTPNGAMALGIGDAAARMHALRGRRLPVSWTGDGMAMRCHPRFREYLLKLLERRGEGELRELRRGYARLLASQRHYEEAVEELLTAGLNDEAMDTALCVIDQVIDRADFPMAERWLERMVPVRSEGRPGLVAAELMLAVAREDYGRGVALADQLAAAGKREALAAASSRAAALMAWCYLHAGRVGDIRAVLEAAGASDEIDAVRYAMSLVTDDVTPEPVSGSLTGGPLDALVMRAHHDRGRLTLLLEPPASPWAARAAEPWRVGALLAAGHTERAFELYQGLEGSRDQGVWLSSVLGPRLMSDIGEVDAAWQLLREGRSRITASGSELFGMFSLLLEAELELLLHGDPAAARAVLEQVRRHPIGRSYAFITEHVNSLFGLAQLLDGDDTTARASLRAAVSSMQRGKRIMLVPAAAVYLAEAEWRTGHEDAADRAANLALAAAEQQGSNHILLDALSQFPAVLTRRLDLERTSDSPWHVLGRVLMSRGVDVTGVLTAEVNMLEFGRLGILVHGEEAQLRLTKSYELLAFLAHKGREKVPRPDVLAALFEGRPSESAASYLRQAVLRLRKVLPDVLQPEAGSGYLSLNPRVRVTAESGRFAWLLGQAAGQRGEDRRPALLEALEITGRGEYLPGIRSAWAEERRQQLAAMAQDARYEAAEIAFSSGDYRQAARLTAEVLRADSFREAAWRLEMRIAHAMGAQDRVVAAYRACARALGELGAKPAPTTERLLNDLRR